MRLVGRPLYRFAAWTVLLVAAAVATGAAGLSWKLILAIVFGVWLLETGTELVLDRRLRHRHGSTPGDSASDGPATELAPAPAPPPAAVAANEAPQVAPEPERRRLRFLSPQHPPGTDRGSAPAVTLPRVPKQWSIWALDKVARETPDAELRYLVLSLQAYADSDGLLPQQFDPLVRESFGALLGIGGAA